MTRYLPSITYGHGFLFDYYNSSLGWTETEDGNTGTIADHIDDWIQLTISASAGNKVYYNSYPDEGGASNLSLSSSTYTKIYWRYKTSDTSIKAKIVLVFSDATTQTVLDEVSSTTITAGSTTITAGKTIDHIRLYANQATGYVLYDYVLICKNAFSIPNTSEGGLRFYPPPKYALLPVPTRIGDITQSMGSPSARIECGCNLDIGTWTRSGDVFAGQVFVDIAHNSKSEPWQWYNDGIRRMKVTLEEPEFIYRDDGRSILNLTFREYRRSSGSNETEIERLGLGLNL